MREPVFHKVVLVLLSLIFVSSLKTPDNVPRQVMLVVLNRVGPYVPLLDDFIR